MRGSKPSVQPPALSDKLTTERSRQCRKLTKASGTVEELLL